MGNAGELTRDLTDRVPGQSLIERLLTEHERGRIRLDAMTESAQIDETARGWYWGVLGERRVAQVLAQLGPHTTVLHSVPVGANGADVDHVVITPSGVFTINTKYSPGSTVWTAGHGMFVNGTTRAVYLRSSAKEARRVTELLSTATGFAVPVHPVIAFVDIASLDRKAPNEVDGVRIRVGTDGELPHLLDIRRELSDEQVARILEVARVPSTWSTSVRPSRPGAHLAQEFDALQSAVGPAMALTRPVTNAPRRRVSTSRRPQRTAPPSPASVPSTSWGRRIAVGCLGLLLFPLVGLAAYGAITWAVSLLMPR